MTTEYLSHDNLVATLRGAMAALREAQTESGTPPSIRVGARLRYAEAVRCCEMVGIVVPPAVNVPETVARDGGAL